MKSVDIKLVPGTALKHEISNGKHSVNTDTANGTTAADGLDPKELTAGALGACGAMTILLVAPARGWDIESLEVKVIIDEEADPNNVGKKRPVVTEEIFVKGNLTQQELDAIKRVAAHCPVYKLLTDNNKRMETLVTHVK